MKIEIDVSEDRKSFTIKVDGGPPVGMENFILLTKEGERTRNLVFGSPHNIGRLLYGLYVNCWKFDETSMREVIELVADDIIGARGKLENDARQTVRRLM